VIVLGMGDDGHTASLFPNMTSLESNSNAFIVTDSPVDPYTRISLTLAAIQAVKRRFVLVRGARKKLIMEHLDKISNPEWPIDKVISDRGATLNWYWAQ
jgi:6-phosphogluconolactonase